MSLVAAGTFLVLRTAKNRVRRALQKLREPRYLVGAAAMTLYLWSLLARPARPSTAPVLPEALGPLAHLALEVGLTAVGAMTVVGAWTLGRDRLSFSFTDAEVTWLLSGPVSRSAILRYKVAVGMLRTLLSAVLVGLVFRRGLASRSAPFFLATWAGFAMVWLHAAGASLVRLRWQARGRSAPLRAGLGALLLLGLAGAAVSAFHGAGPLPAFQPGRDGLPAGELSEWLGRWASSPGMDVLLVPARAFVDAALARSAADAARPLVVLGLFLALLVAWVLLLDAPFEEAALASAERRAQLEARRRRHGIRLPRVGRAAALGAQGPPELALTWKNWLALRRVHGARLGFLLAAVGLGLGFTVWGAVQARAGGGVDLRLLGAILAACFAALTVLFGPLSLRTDLRSDLRRLDVLRALPLSGVQVVRGELLAPLLLLAGTETALLVLALGLSAATHVAGFGLLPRAAWTAGLLLLLPAATASVLVVQNAAALVFPSLLVDDEEHAPRGVEAAGTRLLNLGATLVLLLVGFVPAAVAGILAGAGARAVGLGALAPTVACAAAAGVLAAELVPAVRWMGRGLERLDPTTA